MQSYIKLPIIIALRNLKFNHTHHLRCLYTRTFDSEFDLQRQQNTNKTNEEGAEIFPKQNRFKTNARNVINKNDDTSESLVTKVKAEFKRDPDRFGASAANDCDEDDDAEETYQKEFSSRRAQRLRTIDYARQIKQFLNENRLKDAIAVLETQMLKEHLAKPEPYIYNLLISGCARAGYTRKAFSLFTRMRQRGFKIKDNTYTSLFNACANAPSIEDGLQRANHLRQIMLKKNFEPNTKTHNVMIKAYGRCGDIKTAYMLMDEMIERHMEIRADTFNFLLQACASDSKFGLRHCLLTWHKMIQYNIKPDYYTFNTVLRCIRDCGFGDVEEMRQFLADLTNKQITENNENIELIEKNTENTNVLPMNDNEIQLLNRTSDLTVKTTQITESLPNLLAAKPHLGNLISISQLKQPHERFLLFGGLSGYIEMMQNNNVIPDIKTITTILEVIPPTKVAEKQLLTIIRKYDLKVDIDFFNILIKKRAMRFDYEGGMEVLSMIATAGLRPDIVTYCMLALGCKTETEAQQLLLQMQANDIRMNIQILGAMLRQACCHKSFGYIREILTICLDENIKPNGIFLRHLYTFENSCYRAIDARHPLTKTSSYKKEYAKFCEKKRLFFEEYGLNNLKIEDAIKKIEERPYEQYKENDYHGIEPLKNEKLARKQKYRRYISKIKLEKLSNDSEEQIDDISIKPKLLHNY